MITVMLNTKTDIRKSVGKLQIPNITYEIYQNGCVLVENTWHL